MQIQSIKQSRQQNFGLKLHVVAEEIEKKANLERLARSIFNEINHNIAPELRGKLTLAMQDAGENTDVFIHSLDDPSSIFLTQSAEQI